MRTLGQAARHSSLEEVSETVIANRNLLTLQAAPSYPLGDGGVAFDRPGSGLDSPINLAERPESSVVLSQGVKMVSERQPGRLQNDQFKHRRPQNPGRTAKVWL